MWQDPIIEETRDLRDKYTEQFDHDLDKIFADIRQRQEKSKSKRVSFLAREPAAAKPGA